MDSPRDTNRTAVLETDNESDRGDRGTDRDLRDVLSHLVVTDGDREDVSLRDIAATAGGSERLIPELLAALEDDATAVRIGASWALCALADDQPAAVEYLTERVAERTDGDEPFEVGQVLSYLRGRYPGRVADALDAAAAQDSLGSPADDRTDAQRRDARTTDPARDRRTPDGSGADAPARADSGPDEGKRIQTDGGVPAGAVADLGDGRQVVRPSGGSADGRSRPARPDRPRRPGDAPTGPGRDARPPADRSPQRRDRRPADPTRSSDHPTHPDFDPEEADASSVETAEPDPSPAESRPRTRPTGSEPGRAGPPAGEGDTPADPAGPPVTETDERPETPETFASIAALSSYDRLSAVDRGVADRYATGYRCRAATDGEVRGVATRLFDRPDEGDRLDFRADLEERLARWQALGDGEHVVDVFEWGDRPRSWVATQPVDESLADRDRPSVDRALDQALALTDAVGHCHRHGAVHAGIDPKNVVYPGDSLSGLDRPMLDNVGLMHAFRSYFQPANYLDPRFAAPEYFDDDFGSVDAATDVYGLGAVCYLLFTGRAPFTGSYEEIRRGVLGDRPTAPSAVRDAVPEAVDDVVAKALSKRKIKRYESVDALRDDLERIRDRAD